ncbi:M23 family metallopeptidase [Subsaximicrobium wynnwilliamsii]|uniref:M23 family metallopeptidase n=1 Tax=Subsaximicrobium wynnwilliamsii TaxID=291179 RepID=A0A5C6ZER4_9FLAO|nr:M23 family metallopeptidase [Subsaximicrobium wynnwilliamsii]TXD82059.1 M23 family metallopeptidase [Subsaximicrobium wynnwilliamsii]TXD87261.1 M23 family metallopeptidase [Subsaximicrobium wynnwilliamsii]TXE01519.1 M23 family metallopeptidase [Subsaximicrobium wynnwilliamsii]
MKWNIKLLLILFVFASCTQVQKLSDAITNPSARDLFERDLKPEDSLYRHYEITYSEAKQNALRLDLPSAVSTKTDSASIKILAYTLELKRGERFKVFTKNEADSLQLLIDVYAFENDSVVSKKPLFSNMPNENALEFEVIKNGRYKLVIVSRIQKMRDYVMIIFTEPTYLFPVSGKENSAIQSFWGASRSGGARSHEGVDIFAERGTAVIAASDGYVSSVGNRGLGGEQVWLRDRRFGQSQYYAHLDSIAVKSGAKVRLGDTLGFVGNTGNARTTSPHLHYGIYTFAGAIDPLPFIARKTIPENDFQQLPQIGSTKLRVNELRTGAGVKNEKITDLKGEKPLVILAQTGQWYHARVNDSLEGFIHESLVKF